MSSEFDKRLSLEELKQLNQPQAQPPELVQETLEMGPTAEETHPTAEEWEALKACISAQYKVTMAIYDWTKRQWVRAELDSVEKQLEELTQEVKLVSETLEQVGKKRERRFSIPRITLPRIPLPHLDGFEWFCLLTVPPVLGVLWWSLEKLSSTLAMILP